VGQHVRRREELFGAGPELSGRPRGADDVGQSGTRGAGVDGGQGLAELMGEVDRVVRSDACERHR